MSGNPNKLSQFWQELKRRKVVRVITVYAATALVILELVDIVSPVEITGMDDEFHDSFAHCWIHHCSHSLLGLQHTP